ncbi:MAG: type I-C CRISPR-associated protein Cas8c/Csd1 [Desulfobacterales bacterium RIFOXYA12_FULL_46_15]|nr:MAG: type I-C CRISPR-associated protein Cas8c/Csd1 [Desulfobacterales bacterium RIFOXYA12_FULL_46_15]
MILQALKEYYDRKTADPTSGIAPYGWEWKEIPFLIMITGNGDFCSIQDTREGKSKRGHMYLVPSLGEKKGNGIKSNLFWENIEYVFGSPVPTKSKPNPDPERIREQHSAFQKQILELGQENKKIIAALKFANTDHLERLKKDVVWKEALSINKNLLISFQGDGPITNDPEIRQIINTKKRPDSVNGTCLVTGNNDEIVRLEAPIRGIYGNDQKAERSLVAFNLESFESYGKKKNYNSPIGRLAAFAYTTALNHLLAIDSTQRMLVGDATTVFWSEKDCDLEKQLPDIFGEPPEDDPDRGVKAVESLFKSIENGTYLNNNNDKKKFYVLGLSPNSSRISIRFWIIDTVSGISQKIGLHFKDVSIVHSPRDKDVLSLFRLLVSTAVQGKADKIPPNLAGETIRAILQGLPYPNTLLQAIIRRIRAEHEVTYPRAALIKACINRSTRFKNPHIKEELNMSLDENNTNIGYRLGRLFATLEKIQQEANPGINATIRDRFYGAASGTPSTVFGNLMRLKNHHLSKLDNKGRKIFFEKLLSQIIDGIEAKTSFPSHLPINDQGRFAVGYYHQVQKFFS